MHRILAPFFFYLSSLSEKKAGYSRHEFSIWEDFFSHFIFFLTDIFPNLNHMLSCNRSYDRIYIRTCHMMTSDIISYNMSCRMLVGSTGTGGAQTPEKSFFCSPKKIIDCSIKMRLSSLVSGRPGEDVSCLLKRWLYSQEDKSTRAVAQPNEHMITM